MCEVGLLAVPYVKPHMFTPFLDMVFFGGAPTRGTGGHATFCGKKGSIIAAK